ncbi:MAG: ABC-three component system middle component 6 [Planctomycetota bacterium]
MILPTKHLDEQRSLLRIGAEVLQLLGQPKTVSRLWDDLKSSREEGVSLSHPITYDWFVMALDLLYMISVVEYDQGRLTKAAR